MPLQLFLADSKVKKDRNVMKQADTELAKRSLRGIVASPLVYLLTLLVSDFYAEHTRFALSLAVALTILAGIRAMLVLRFENLYASAPQRWRNQYIFWSIISSGVWSAILVAHILYLGLSSTTTALLLYTAALCGGICIIYAPYLLLCRYVVAITTLPASVALISLNAFDAYLYGLV